MSARAIGVLALLAASAVVAVILAGGSNERRNSSEALGEPFLPGLAERLDGLTAVRAVRGGGELIARVARRREGWVVTNRWGYPADTATVRGLLDELVAARRVAPKADDAAGHGELGVGPIASAGERTVAVTLEGVGEGLAVVLGEAAAGDVAGRYVRRVDAQRAWQVEPAIERPDRIADWLDERLVDIGAESIVQVAIDPVDGEPVHVRRSEGALVLERPAGRAPLSATTARSLARVVADLRLTDVRPAADAPAWPRLATARYRTAAGLVIRLQTYAPRRGAERHLVRLQAHVDTEVSERVRERAARLNERWSGWVYTIPEYKLTNATRTLEAVLR